MRTSYVIKTSLKTFFVASVMSSIITQLNMLVDGIIVSHIVSGDAISVINMCSPVFAIVMLVASMLYTGGGVLMANAIGNQKYDTVNRIYTVSIAAVLLTNLVVGVAGCLFVDQIANMLTSEERLLPLLKAYMPISFVGNLFTAFQLTLAQFIKVSGQPSLVTRCLMLESISNIVLDVLFVMFFGWGMPGAAMASALAALLSTVVFIPYLKSADRAFSFVKVPAGSILPTIGGDVRRGLPVAIGTIVMSAMMLILNELVLRTKGADGMFILSVCMQVLMLSMLLLGGAGSALTGIGGVLLGEYDYEAIRKLLTLVFKMIICVTSCFTVFVFIFPEVLASLFGAKGDLLQATLTPLRQFSLIMIPIGLIIPLSNFFVVLNRNTLASFINIGMLVGLVPIVFLSILFFPDYLWLSMSIAMWLVLGMTVACVFVISRRNKGLHWFFLAPQIDDRNTISMSVGYSRKDAIDKLTKATAVLKERNILCYNAVFHCLEEIVLHEVERGMREKKDDVFDIFSTYIDDRFTIVFKSVGKPYNPLSVLKRDNDGDVEDVELMQVRILKWSSTDINYKYMNGVNCLYINVDVKPQTKQS